MIGKSFILLLTFVYSLLFINCSGSGNETNNQLTKFPEGRELYLSKCTSCHRAYEREKFTAEKWKAVLNEMTVKAKLNDDEKTLILNYLSER
ncbi:MAG TPA: hypothetical protein PKA80_07405 [Ignavibacteriaceae bacterium]|nr:hypothetical protein [Ignavibacteriaceae bacterium]